jgi:CheY-like chemotaxis protein
MCADSRTVLIVDDDTVIRDTLADVITEEGYDAITAVNGQDALDKLHDGVRPCVILLDLMMPVMTGAELYQQMKSDPLLADIPVVVISADGNVQAKAQSFGGDYLSKPVKVDPVIQTVARHCT